MTQHCQLDEKLGCSLRSILCQRISPRDRLAVHLVGFLGSRLGKSLHHVKNLEEFIYELQLLNEVPVTRSLPGN